jgi:hypothetical protein
MPTCQIKWVGRDGRPTPDDNDSIGTVYREAYTEFHGGRDIFFPETERFHICAEHVKQLSGPGMYRWHFEAL